MFLRCVRTAVSRSSLGVRAASNVSARRPGSKGPMRVQPSRRAPRGDPFTGVRPPPVTEPEQMHEPVKPEEPEYVGEETTEQDQQQRRQGTHLALGAATLSLLSIYIYTAGRSKEIEVKNAFEKERKSLEREISMLKEQQQRIRSYVRQFETQSPDSMVPNPAAVSTLHNRLKTMLFDDKNRKVIEFGDGDVQAATRTRINIDQKKPFIR